MVHALQPEKLALALDAIATWRLAPDQPVACPACREMGLGVIDQSSRPYAEWYALSCGACGLEHTLHIPLGPAVMGGLD